MSARLFWDHMVECLWIALAVFGGVAKSLDPFLRTGTAPSLSTILVHGFVSGFSGYVTAQAVSLIYPEWAIVAAGVGGYAGTEGLSFFISIAKKKLGSALGEEKV
jgi:hypothetical protein